MEHQAKINLINFLKSLIDSSNDESISDEFKIYKCQKLFVEIPKFESNFVILLKCCNP